MQAIGIDLGTTFSCVAAFQNGRPTIFHDGHHNTIPSVVAFQDGQRIVGWPARDIQLITPQQVVYDAKRLIGRKFDEEEVQNDIQNWPFTIKKGEGGLPKICVEENGKDIELFPEQISALVLRKLLMVANSKSTKDFKKAVITVPAYFNDAQRQATKVAGEIAGLEVLSTINEPTAAAIAYGLQNAARTQKVLVFDFGGGTLDVTILSLKVDGGRRDFDVLSTKGDLHLGGEDIDQALLKFILDDIKKKYNDDFSRDNRAKQQIRRKAEKAKIDLSSAIQVDVDFSYNGKNYKVQIKRSDLEYVCDDIFSRCIDPMDKALEAAKLETSQIDTVILVGGSTHIPAVKDLVEEYMGKKPYSPDDPSEAVALGAAIFAKKLVGGDDEVDDEGTIELIDKIGINDIVPRALGTTLVGDIFDIVVPEGAHIPGKWEKKYCTAYDNQTTMRNEVREVVDDENDKASKQHLLDVFTVSGIKPAPARSQSVIDRYEIDTSGTLKVTSIVESNGETYSTTIKGQQYQHSREDILAMRKDHEQYVKAEDEIKRRSNVLDQLEQMVAQRLREKSGTSSESKLRALLKETRTWINNNRSASLDTIDEKMKEVRRRMTSM